MKFTCLAFALGALGGCGAGPQPVDLLVSNVTIYSGTDPVPATGSIVVADGRFVAVGPIAAGDYAAATTFDGSGLYAIPGLWDAHVHLRSSSDGGLEPGDFLPHGVTSLRDMGSVAERMQALQIELKQGRRLAPTIYTSYSTINGEVFGPHHRAVTSTEEVVAVVDELAASGASMIKIHRATVPELLPAIINEAHRHGLTVTGHIPLGVHPLDACETGMDGIEHAASFIEALVSVGKETGFEAQRSAGRWLLSAEAGPLFECLARRGVAVMPSLVVYSTIARLRSAGGEMRPEFVETIDMLGKLTLRLYQAGVPLLVGTDVADSAMPGWHEPGLSLHEELVMLGQAGIPPADLVAMASLEVARSVEADAVSGSIEAGKIADFVLLAADPGESAENFRSILSVFRSGEEVFTSR